MFVLKCFMSFDESVVRRATMTVYSTRLFSMPSFIEGIARILDFGSTLEVYNQSPTPQHADVEALLSDWMAIGEDMTLAIQDITMEGSSTDG